MSKLTFKISGMCCSEEVAAIKRALNPLVNGREELISFDLISEKITIENHEDLLTENEIIQAIQTTGMTATPWKTYTERRHLSETFWQKHRQAIMATLSALSLGAGFMTDSIENGVSSAFFSSEDKSHVYPPEVIALYAIAMLTGSWFVIPKALRSIFKLRPDMNLLMTTAIGGAALIGQWFEAGTTSTLFSTSLLLESWNVNRARKSIRALVELSPSTARVVEKRAIEKRLVKTNSNKKYFQHSAIGDGDCGYTVLGFSRENALKQLIESIDSIQAIVKPAVQECLLTEDFYYYLIENKVISNRVTHQQIIRNIEAYVSNLNVLEYYLYYDIKDKRVNAGWSHPCVLQALASIQQIVLHMWQLNQDDDLVPFQGYGYDHIAYIPIEECKQINILFVNNGNHFEKIEFYENDLIIEDDIIDTSALSLEQNMIIEKMVEEIPIGSVIVVRPGEKIPMDSILISDSTDINQAPITGESLPVRKETGDELFAGTINGDTAILCRVTKISSDSTLARVINLVETAQSNRATTEQFIEKFANYYTPFMMLLSLALFISLPTVFGQSWEGAFYQALEILVIACPCALVISTPISIVAGLSAAARLGVLIKGGAYLEAPAHIKAIALDKTGTLTSGEPTVQKITTFNGLNKQELLEIALALEEQSDHPLARAIRRKAKSEEIFTNKQVEGFHILKGKGAEGHIQGTLFWIGSRRLVQEKIGEILPIELHQEIKHLENNGYSVVVIGYGQNLCGLIGISDSVREGCRDAIRALKKVGIEKIIMLTGDNKGAADAIARSVEIDDYRANLLPEYKVEEIEALMKTYQRVAMVGDGINDAPAMAVSSLSIAMGAAGSDAAIETADIALMSDDLAKLSWLIKHSRRTLSIIKQNVAISLSIKGLFIALVIANKSTLGMAILADMGTSFLVIFNALRLLNNPCLSWNLKSQMVRDITHDNDKQSHQYSEIELITANTENISFHEGQEELLPKKSCCSDGSSCSKPNEKQSLLHNETKVNIDDTESLSLQEQQEELLPKKPCCSGASCSESKNSNLVQNATGDSKNSKLTMANVKSIIFNNQQANLRCHKLYSNNASYSNPSL